jgi:hypothetical protein
MRIAGIEFRQTAFVTLELSQGVSALDGAAGVGDWAAYELPGEAFAERWYRGTVGTFEVRHALSWRGDDQWEVCEAGREPSVWREFAQAQATRVHHVGAYVDDLDAAAASLVAQGWTLVQQASGFGLDGDGEFRYFEHASFPLLAELIDPPARRRPTVPVAADPPSLAAPTQASGDRR